MRYLLALDQGTTSSRALLFDQAGRQMGMAQREFTQHFPQPGWVEHDPEEIWHTQLVTAREVLTLNRIRPQDVAAIGITNQRETTVVWERSTGKAIHHALVWQDRRTADICERLRADGHEDYIRAQTGLVPDAYFSGTKLRWLLDFAAENGYQPEDLCFGTIDSWLIWKLTGGTRHVTDASNASRTLLYNIRTHRWDERLCAALGVPVGMLPEVLDSAGHFGTTVPELFGAAIPIMGVAGDQQAALFGQACFEPGEAKNTYGTGCFLLMQTGNTPVQSTHGLLTTIAWQLGGEVTYALEGSVFIAGAAIQWLRDGLGMIGTAAESEVLAASVSDTDGVYLVPAFAGLGAPWWDMYARGILTGLTRGTTAAHITRAALESIAYQTRDVLDAMERDSGIHLSVLRVDGGATANDLLMQFQADLLDTPVQRPAYLETTAWGAACLAGIGAGIWDQAHLRTRVGGPHPYQRVYMPRMQAHERQSRYTGWQTAVRQAMLHGIPPSQRD